MIYACEKALFVLVRKSLILQNKNNSQTRVQIHGYRKHRYWTFWQVIKLYFDIIGPYIATLLKLQHTNIDILIIKFHTYNIMLRVFSFCFIKFTQYHLIIHSHPACTAIVQWQLMFSCQLSLALIGILILWEFYRTQDLLYY